MKTFFKYLPVVILVYGILSFIINLIIGVGLLDPKMALPLNGIQSIVEKNDKVYIGLGYYSRVQIYSLDGGYIRRIHTPTYSKDFDFAVEHNDEINTNVIYIRQYKVDSFYQQSGRTYRVEGLVFKKIMVLENGSERIFLQDSIWKSLSSGVVIPWLVAFIGILLLMIFNPKLFLSIIDKRIKRKTNTNTMNREIKQIKLSK